MKIKISQLKKLIKEAVSDGTRKKFRWSGIKGIHSDFSKPPEERRGSKDKKKKEDDLDEAQLVESVSRYCEFWKDTNGKWWMDLASDEYGDWEDSTTYGPFNSEKAADNYLSMNFSNPGSLYSDDSGERPPPTKSPNGRPVQKVGSQRRSSYGRQPWPRGRW